MSVIEPQLDDVVLAPRKERERVAPLRKNQPLPSLRLRVVVSKYSPHLYQLGIDPTDERASGELHIAALWLSMNLPHANDLNAVRWCGVADEAMQPTIHPYDLALVDESVHKMDVPGVFLLDWEGKPAIRRVQRVDGLTVTIASDSQRQQSTLLLVDDLSDIEVYGRVVWVWKGQRL